MGNNKRDKSKETKKQQQQNKILKQKQQQKANKQKKNIFDQRLILNKFCGCFIVKSQGIIFVISEKSRLFYPKYKIRNNAECLEKIDWKRSAIIRNEDQQFFIDLLTLP